MRTLLLSALSVCGCGDEYPVTPPPILVAPGSTAVPQPQNPNQPVVTQPQPMPSTDPAFTINAGDVKMLPYRVLLGKLAKVAQVPETSALLSEIVANRFEFGDADYANGVQPNSSWTTAKLTLWVRSLRQLCQSQEFTKRFKLPQGLDAFAVEAFGRHSTPLEATELASLANDTGPDAPSMSCLVLLASAEFVTR